MTCCEYCRKQIILTAYGDIDPNIPTITETWTMYFCDEDCKANYLVTTV